MVLTMENQDAFFFVTCGGVSTMFLGFVPTHTNYCTVQFVLLNLYPKLEKTSGEEMSSSFLQSPKVRGSQSLNAPQLRLPSRLPG